MEAVSSAASQLASKWLGLVAGMWVQAAGGNAYMFPHYSPLMKTVLHYNQLQLNSLGAAKDIGENVGLLAGLLCNRLPVWLILSIGAVESVFGYGIAWLVISGRIGPLPFWQMCALLLIGANTATWFNTAVLVTCMRNFPASRGSVVGILKGFVGLSGAIFTQVFASFLGKDPGALLLLLAVAPLAVCLVAMWFVRPVSVKGATEEDQNEETNYFFFINVVSLAMAFYLLGATLVEDLFSVGHLTSHMITSVMLLFLLAPLAVPGRYLIDAVCGPPAPHIQIADAVQGAPESSGAEEPLLAKQGNGTATVEDWKNGPGRVSGRYDFADPGALRGDLAPISEIEELDTLFLVGEGAVLPAKRRKGPRRGEDFKLRQALVKADFWLLFLAYFSGVGTGITVINNMGQIGQSLGYADVSIFVSLVCICNFLGRLGGGAVSEYFVRLDAIPRTVWMGVAEILMILNYLLFATALPGTLYICSVILGICYGVHFSIMVPTASELFGLKHFGMIYNFMTMANPVGSVLVSGWIAGTLYDREAMKQGGGNSSLGSMLRGYIPWFGEGDESVDDLACLGPQCYRLTFLILAVICGMGLILNVVLTLRIRRVYVALYKSPSRNESQDTLFVADDGTVSTIPRVGSRGILVPSSAIPRNGSRGSLISPSSLPRSGSQGSLHKSNAGS